MRPRLFRKGCNLLLDETAGIIRSHQNKNLPFFSCPTLIAHFIYFYIIHVIAPIGGSSMIVVGIFGRPPLNWELGDFADTASLFDECSRGQVPESIVEFEKDRDD